MSTDARWMAIAPEDVKLVEQTLGGDKSAADVLFKRYRLLIFSVCLKILHDRAEAEDVTQEIMLEVWQKASKYDAERGTVKMWLLQYAYSRSLNRRGVLANRREAMITPPRSVPALLANKDYEPVYPELILNEDPVARISLHERSVRMKRALEALPEHYRRVIGLVYFSGIDLHKVADIVKLEYPIVRLHYYRGITKLKEIFESGEDL